MKTIQGFVIVIGLALGSFSVQAQTSFETAQVLESRPIYQIVEISAPQEQCWEEEIAIDRYPGRYQSRTPVLLSTVIGGAIGNALGHGRSNRQVGAVVGAVLGHSIGRDIMQRSTPPASRQYETVQRCETVYQQTQEERLVGYQVTYLFNGEEFSVRTKSDPGAEIRLRVTVQPVL